MITCSHHWLKSANKSLRFKDSVNQVEMVWFYTLKSFMLKNELVEG